MQTSRYIPMHYTATGQSSPTPSSGLDTQMRGHCEDLQESYDKAIQCHRLSWTGHYHFRKLLGEGGQGEVYLGEYRGTDSFTLPVAIKVFSPKGYSTARRYGEAMAKIAEISARIALIQHDHVLDIQNFLERDRIRMMIMEWVDGYDLGRLIRPNYLSDLERCVTVRRWRYINDVILTSGTTQSRFKPGVAVAIVRDCLGALAALHREGIVHGDVKPSNIMLKRTGHCKLIDMGSALDYRSSSSARYCTPQYAAPEVLETRSVTPLSDLASVGYVLVELLSGRAPFPGQISQRALLQAKLDLPQRLCEVLPQEVIRNELLMNFLLGLISPDPNSRFPSAEAADLVDRGAAAFQRQLIIGNMATEYDNDLRLWLEELRHLEV